NHPHSNCNGNSCCGSPLQWPYHPLDLHSHFFNEMLAHSDAQGSSASSATGSAAIAAEVSSSGDTAGPPNVNGSFQDLLCECVCAVTQGHWQRSIQLINILSQRASPLGDSTERVVSHFVDSLAGRIVSALGESQVMSQLVAPRLQALDNITTPLLDEDIQAAFLFFNQVSPFLIFSHLTANQAILEAMQGWEAVHIVDMEIMQGVQWPPLLQALAEREGGPPRVRISGVGQNAGLLAQTGSRLTTFAASLGLPMFEFHSIHITNSNSLGDLNAAMLETRPGEALAINCMPQLRCMCEYQSQAMFVSLVSSVQPTIITIAERETNYNQGSCQERFKEAFQHYAALFESLEAMLPPSSTERRGVENVLLKGEIRSVVAAREGNVIENPYSKWREVLRENGFNARQHSGFALSQARLLLRLRYPSEGYSLQEEADCLLLGWQHTPLFGVSAWS
ncbi:hypothetical protein GOP47_0027971, partial [Adiantum capillus-veneris]